MKKRHLAILALAATCAPGFRSNAQTTQITRIAHIAYRSGDLDKEVAFLKKLGFEEAFSSTNAAGKTTQAFLKVNDQQFIEVYPQSDPAQPLGWMHVCYESGDLNALYATLTANGLKPSEVRKAGAGNLISSLDDPEGRVTEFTQYMPGSRHTLDKGQHLGEHRISVEMLGFSLPVPDLEAARKFYVAGMGFEARDARSGLRISLPAIPEMRIQIRAAAAGLTPETLFRVADIAAAAEQLKALCLQFEQQGNRIVVHDPDGNVFAFIAPRIR